MATGLGRRIIGFLVAVVVAGLTTVVPAVSVGAIDPGARVYVSSSSAGSVDGISFTSGDILVFDSAADTWAMFFDGSAAGLGSANIDGFNIVDSTPSASTVEMTFTGPVTVAGLGSIDDSDVVTFTGTTGAVTSGTFAKLIDGSDVGLTSGGEDLDALAATGSGYATSTLGSGSVPKTGGGNLAVTDEDLVLFSGSTGDPTSGSFSQLLDGSDVGFTADMVSAYIDPTTGEVFGSSLNGYNINGLSGDGDDIFMFTGTTGPTTSGTFALFFDGDQNRFGGEQIDGLHIEPGIPTSPGSADLEVTLNTSVGVAAVAGDTVTYTVDVLNNGPDQAVNVVVTGSVPAGLTFVSTSGCVLDPNGLPCSLGSVAPGATASFTVTTTVDGSTSGEITVAATATSSTADPVPANNNGSESFLVAAPPVAEADGPATSSTPGSLFHTDVDTPLIAPAPGLLANDNLGSPAAALTSFGGGDLGGTVSDHAAGQNVSVGSAGSLQVNADGSLSFTPDAGATGPFTFDYRIANQGGTSEASVTIYIGPRPSATGGDMVYLSTAGSGTVDAVAFDDEDIIVHNSATDTWALFFDGSDVGLGLTDLNGFNIETLDPMPVIQLTFAGRSGSRGSRRSSTIPMS